MNFTQISLFLENRIGRMGEVSHVLADAGVNIMGLTIAETEKFGIVRLVVDKPEKAVEALKKNNFLATLTDVVVAGISDQPGGLARVLDVLSAAGINIEYMHGLLTRTGDTAYMVFRFNDTEKAVDVLKNAGVQILSAGN